MTARYVSFRQAAGRYPFTEAGFRWLRFNDTDGFNTCVIKVGRRVLIDTERFESWLQSHVEQGNSRA